MEYIDEFCEERYVARASLLTSGKESFLDASSYLQRRVCWFIGPSVCPISLSLTGSSGGQGVSHKYTHTHTAKMTEIMVAQDTPYI